MLAFVFPGQGSQSKGMGAHLFDTVSQFIELEEQINDVLGYCLKEICLENPGDILKNTEYTQPCLYTVNALHYYQKKEHGIVPDFVAGHSLGEYNALLAAGAFDFLTGLRLVKKRGELMAETSRGAMAAIIGLVPEEITSVIDAEGFSGVQIANYNSPQQIVISGVASEITRVLPALAAAGAKACVPLPVSAAFHSRLMEGPAGAFEKFLGQFTFQSLQIPVVSNLSAAPYTPGDPSSVVRWSLSQQICGPVCWAQSIRYMQDAGVKEFQETGPGSVLTGLIENISPKSVNG